MSVFVSYSVPIMIALIGLRLPFSRLMRVSGAVLATVKEVGGSRPIYDGGYAENGWLIL
jgi:hypothetical protein